MNIFRAALSCCAAAVISPAVADDCDFWMETRRSWIKIP
jgi:hypothetical protein